MKPHVRLARPVAFLMYGGTIDAQSYLHTGDYIRYGKPPENITPLERSLIPETLAGTPHGEQCEFIQKPMVDSKAFFGQADDPASLLLAAERRAGMVQAMRAVRQKKLVFSVGTDGLADITRFMDDSLRMEGKTAIFLGSMEPLSHGKGRSRGFETLDYAVLTQLGRDLPPGAYAAVPDEQGRLTLFHADETLAKRIEDLPDGRDKRYFTGTPVSPSLAASPGAVRA